MQARYYDPVIGRFLSNDPVGFAQGGVDYFNRYSYTANDPVNATDPDGRFKVTIGLGGKISKGLGLKGAASLSFDTNGNTLTASVSASGRAGAAGAVKGTFSIEPSGDFVKSDIKIGLGADAESGLLATGQVDVGGKLSLRDGFSVDGDLTPTISGVLETSGANGFGGTAQASAGADAGIGASASVSISGTEVVNAASDGVKAVGSFFQNLGKPQNSAPTQPNPEEFRNQ